MKRHIIAVLSVALWCCTSIVAAQTFSPERSGRVPMSFKVFTVPSGLSVARIEAVAQALEFQSWPDTESLFNSPRISKTLLKYPTTVTQESHSCTNVAFGDTLWSDCNWSWRRLTERKESLPTELPAERKKQLLETLTEEQRKDSQFVESYLKNRFERYRKTQRYHLEGQVDIEVCLTPSGRAAKEFLLVKLTDNMLPTESLAAIYIVAKQPERLGTIGFVAQSRSGDDRSLIFVRNNVFVRIQATGFFVEEALSIAQKIDNIIIHQPSLTIEELKKRIN